MLGVAMEHELRHHLISCARALAAHRGIEPTTVARLAAGDWRFLDRIASGSSFTARKYDQVMRWFSDQWPDDLPWPSDVPRPSVPPGRPPANFAGAERVSAPASSGEGA